MLPAIFLSHGSPMLAVEPAPARQFLSELPGLLPEQPAAILVASAHWERRQPAISAPAVNGTIHDFGGFPRQLYQLSYPATGAPALASRAVDLLARAGFVTGVERGRGLDHGAWVPLLVAWPDASIPVAQISIQTPLGPAHHLDLGRALAPLRREGVLIIGSGSFTHDLASFRTSRGVLDAPEPRWVSDFADWMVEAVMAGRTDDLLYYRTRAPEAEHNHPTEEHLLPLFVAMGAGGTAAHLHRSTTYGILRMDAFAFA